MDTFGEWLRQQRNQLKLTREQFAERVGCSVALLRKIEDGERRPSTPIAELMANGLNIPPAERSTFVRVARGELNVEGLSPAGKPVAASSAAAHPRNPHCRFVRAGSTSRHGRNRPLVAKLDWMGEW